MEENNIQKNGMSATAKVLIIICIVLSCAIIAAAIIIPTAINENQKKLNGNQEMTNVIDNIRNKITSYDAEEYDYRQYNIEAYEAYKQKGDGLLSSDYVEEALKNEYKKLLERIDYYEKLHEIEGNIWNEKYATANNMLTEIAQKFETNNEMTFEGNVAVIHKDNEEKTYREPKWEKYLHEILDLEMCEKLNYERIEREMYELMKENGITKTYRDTEKEEFGQRKYIYPEEAYGICGECRIEQYNPDNEIGMYVINTNDKGRYEYNGYKTTDMNKITKDHWIYLAMIVFEDGRIRTLYYTYENNITDPCGNYKDY